MGRLWQRLREADPVLVGLFVVWALVSAAIWFWPVDDTDVRYYHTYLRIWTEAQKLRGAAKSSSESSEWGAFASRGRAELGRILEDLEETASSREPVKQLLLWAGRDCLMPMLEGSHPVDTKRFRRYMRDARRELQRQGFAVPAVPD